MRVKKPSKSMLTGTHINYYFVCKRKLWLFAHGVQMEQTSDTVLLGKLIDESSYERKDKSIDIDGSIVIDWIDLPAGGQAGEKNGVLHEVKKLDSMEDAHKWQVLYYLWYLKQKGVTGVKGEIDYPKLRQKVEVTLTPNSETKLLEVMKDAESIAGQVLPPDRIKNARSTPCGVRPCVAFALYPGAGASPLAPALFVTAI
jgi:CRISPR-associated exonuclease Cas4